MRLLVSRRRFLLPLLAFTLVAFPATAASPAGGAKPIEYVDGVPDTGQFLPNSELLGRVGDRRISVLAFRTAYFQSDPHFRPSGDSLGRAEYLTNMMRKDVLGLTALSAGYALGFEDRATLRAFRTTLVSNRFFEVEVMDVPEVPEDSLRKVYEWMRTEIRARALSFADRAEAEAAHASLVRGRTTWDALAAKLNAAAGQRPADLRWLDFQSPPIDVAVQLWTVAPGKFSGVVATPAGYQIVQVLERRPRATPDYEFVRGNIRQTLRTNASARRRVALMAEAKLGLDFRYDTTNVKWASRHYFLAIQTDSAALGRGIVIEERVPEFSPADTSRTLLTWKGGRLSLGQLASAYQHLAAVMRPPINTPEQLMDYADALALEDRLFEMATQRGYEKDPAVVERYERKLEEILVTRLVEDSCFSRIVVTPKERREYYDRNRSRFFSYPSARAAFIVRDTQEQAEAVRARLAAGEPVAAVLRADSLAGEARSGTKVVTGAQYDPLEKLLFEELRPGQSRVLGPDKQGQWACVQSLEFDPGRLLPYEQLESQIDESVRNIKAERALNEFVDRLRARYEVELHYDKLMGVKLTTPGPDERD